MQALNQPTGIVYLIQIDVSIPYSSGEKCKRCGGLVLKLRIKRGRFNPLFIRGKMQVPEEVAEDFLRLLNVSIPYSSGEKCKFHKPLLPPHVGRQFQSLIHQGKNASLRHRFKLFLLVYRFQSLIHQGKNASITRKLAFLLLSAVSIPYSSGEKCKDTASRTILSLQKVSIPYSSGEKCKDSSRRLNLTKMIAMRFQSLIHQGKNASVNFQALSGMLLSRFNPLFIRGKMQAPHPEKTIVDRKCLEGGTLSFFCQFFKSTILLYSYTYPFISLLPPFISCRKTRGV